MLRQIIPENAASEFLSINLIKTKFVEIDIWSFTHLIGGVILFFLINFTRFTVTNKFIAAFVLLVAYEVLEFVFIGVFFSNETMLNRIYDILIAMIGFAIMFMIFGGN
tara:strand:- start:306 stop:629 length:324 start_codon:yes stop_codon:yes gene_type:complete